MRDFPSSLAYASSTKDDIGMTSKVLLAFVLSLSIVIAAIGQQPSPTPQPRQPESDQKPTAPEVDTQDVVKITTNLVQIDAVVTKDGKAVTDLQPADFEISEDNKPQAITNFSYISNLSNVATATVPPLKNAKDNTAAPVPPAKINPNDQRRIVALVVDDLGISFEGISPLRTQIRKFLDTLAPNDLVAIIRTGGDVGALQQFTNDRRVLQAAVDHLRWNPCSRAGMHVFAPVGAIGSNTGLCSQYIINGTFKSLQFIVRGMGDLPGRKSLVFFSDYLPIQDQQPSAYEETQNLVGESANPANNSDDPSIPDSGIGYLGKLQKIAELAIRGSVVIYSVDTRGLQYTGPTAADRLNASARTMNDQLNTLMNNRSRQLTAGREGSDLIAKQTGGFMVRNSNDFGLKRVMQDQEGYYLIGFRPTEETFNRHFHHIKIKVKRGGLTVRSREGFYGYTNEEARPKNLSADDEMSKALISPFNAKDINVRLTSFFFDDPKEGALIRSFVFLDSHDLNFSEADSWHSTNLDIQTVVFGDNGRVIAKEDRNGRLRFRADGYDRALREGIAYSFDIPVKARGAFQFRVAVRDLTSNKIGSAGQFIDVPNLRAGALAISGIVAREIPANGVIPDTEPVASGPAVRQFRQGTTVAFAHAIYNGVRQGQPAQLYARIRLVRDGKIVFNGEPTPVTINGQPDPQRLTNVMKLQIGNDLIPGDYVCQIIVTDGPDNSKPRVASRWIDFEIVK
jgi:VWFA-related protein